MRKLLIRLCHADDGYPVAMAGLVAMLAVLLFATLHWHGLL